MFARKISYNLLAVFINQFLGIMLGMIVLRLFILKLGYEANGLINSVSHILVYLGLLDAGIGMASLQALYRPVAENDKMRICEILSATKYQYRKIGMLYFAGLFVISAVMPFTISSNFSFIQIALVVLFSGLPSVIRFFLQGKFIILLTAEGKGYILSFFESIIHLAVTIAKIILLFYGFGLVAIQFSFFCIGLLQVCFIYIYMKKQYKWVNFKCTPDFTAISQSKNVLIHQISLLVFSNTDIIIITYFCGLKVVSVYVIYTMLLGIPMRFSSFFGSIIFSLAHTWNTDKERYIKLHDMMEMLYNTLTFSLLCRR